MSKGNAPDLILGTAGHIDHGKSSLILALTGTDPDRLAEEKQRGITIELGFAQIGLPDGRHMGVVDVPGHERFVKQMIAGATGIDVALLAIAADDGVMPQTVEHLAVLQTLGVPALVVALTKADLVDEDWIEFMADEIRSFLSGTPYRDAAIVPCSSKTGAGLDDVRSAIQAACSAVRPSRQHRAMREPVDRVFTIKGAGTVITGTLWSGTVKPGDTVEVLPGGKTSRVRSVQEHDRPVDRAHAGNRVALNLADLSTDEIRPGDFLAAPGTLGTTDRFDAQFTYLDTAKTGKPLASGTKLHVAHGTREVTGRVLFDNGVKLVKSGTSLYAQIRLDEALAIASGDRFIVRSWSPVQVIGGGRVLVARPRRRTALEDGERRMLDALRDEDAQSAVEEAAALEPYPFRADDLAWTLGLPAETVDDCLNRAVEARKLITLSADGRVFHTTKRIVQKHVAAIERTLLDFHTGHPQSTGITAKELHQLCAPRCDADAFGALIDEAERAGKASIAGGQIGHPSAQGAAQAAVDDAAAKILAVLDREIAAPPLADGIAAEAGVSPALAKRALNALERDGRTVRIAPDIYLSAAGIDACKGKIAAYLNEHGSATVAELKDAIGTTRRYAVPLLEYFDGQGITVRDGNNRSLGR